MSRTLSVAARAALFAQESDNTLVTLLTFTGTGISPAIRLCDNFTQRISDGINDEEIMYGLVSRSNNYIFLPFQITLPTEEAQSIPRAQLRIDDVTRYLTPTIRSITSPPNLLIELVLKTTPNVVEASFSGLQLASIGYDANSMTADLSLPSLILEPFPGGTFTPSYFPGMF